MNTRECRNCYVPFEHKRSDHWFCSGKCCAAFYRANPNPEMIHADLPHDFPHVCEECGVPYTVNGYAERGGKREPKYCSPRCKQKAYRARGKVAQQQAQRRYQGTAESEARARADQEWQAKQAEAQRQAREDKERRERQENRRRPGVGKTHMNFEQAMDILGLQQAHTKAELRKAWMRAMKKVHPDVNPSPDATKDAQRVNAAYEYLKNR